MCQKFGPTLSRPFLVQYSQSAKAALPARAVDEVFISAVEQEATGAIDTTVVGFQIFGNKGLVGDTFVRNVFYIRAEQKGAASRLEFVRALENEARGAGARKLSIVGHEIMNKGFLNPLILERFGFKFRQVNDKTIHLQKDLE